jgi:predicted nucleic acid-binding protein
MIDGVVELGLVPAGDVLQLRRQGTPIPTNDLWIAALVLQHDLVLCARDRHFDHLPQITQA